MEVTGNTVADAIALSRKKTHLSKAFEQFPTMKGKKFIFITIHRRENCEKKERFLAIYHGIKKLIER